MNALYDNIGIDYGRLRRPDVRIAQAISDALGDAETVLNVGAGTGSYEPSGKRLIALEPSRAMIRQRPVGAAPVVQATAERLPFRDNAFDASMAILTVHHWIDQSRGLREMRRVTRGPVVILTFDPAATWFWLADYLPELAELDRVQMPSIQVFDEEIGPIACRTVPIPHDCTDGFLAAYWRRPAAYLDPRVRAAISSFALLDIQDDALNRLKCDLGNGAWNRKYGHLRDVDALDCGYRLVVSES